MKLEELKNSHLHFIGIGGSGMSGLARISIALGIPTSGSDAKNSSALESLKTLGAQTFIGHSSSQIKDGQVVVVSSAIGENNPELVAAKKLNAVILTRAQLLAIFMQGQKSVAVAGTHGKTTTTSALTVALQSMGLNPSFAIGGTINRGGTNAHLGSGEYFIAEADESDGSFLEYKPFGAIITNIELDHVDNFPNIDAIRKLFLEFINSIQKGGFLILCVDSPEVKGLLNKIERKDLQIIQYGESSDQLTFSNLSLQKSGSFSRVIYKGKVLGEMELSIPGEHNVLNALAVVGAALALNLSSSEVIAGVKNFTGARRRFEIRGTAKGVTVIDDYGHHPTEIVATLKAARTFVGTGRVIVIFQPHRYSRTKAFLNEFSEALKFADKSYILEIYSAGEDPIPGVSSELIARGMENGIFNPSMIEVVEEVVKEIKPGDLVITLGAGDVNALVPVILESLNAN